MRDTEWLHAVVQAADPMTRGPGFFDATTKLAIGEVVILFSFLAFAQSIRMMNHLVSCAAHTLARGINRSMQE